VNEAQRQEPVQGNETQHTCTQHTHDDVQQTHGQQQSNAAVQSVINPAKVTIIWRVTLAGMKISLKVTIILRVTFSVRIHRV